MTAAVGHPTLRLIRAAIGAVTLGTGADSGGAMMSESCSVDDMASRSPHGTRMICDTPESRRLTDVCTA